MKHVVRNRQELEALLDERCEKGLERGGDWEWEWGGFTWLADAIIVLNAKGMWFDKNIVSELCIWGGEANHTLVTKIEPECRQKVINTIMYIQENFDHVYQAMLEKILLIATEHELLDLAFYEPITTIRQLHEAREIREISGMEADCIRHIQLNCQYQKDDMVFYSWIFQPSYGFGDGFEVVFWRDHVVCVGDGNTGDLIFEFEDYKDTPFYFEINDV